MSSRHRRDGYRSYDNESIGYRNPAYFGPNASDSGDRDEVIPLETNESEKPSRSSSMLAWFTFSLTLMSAAFSIVAMIFGIMNKSTLSTVQSRLQHGISDADLFSKGDIFIRSTHGRTYYEDDVPSLQQLEHVSQYIQEILYPEGAEVIIQKSTTFGAGICSYKYVSDGGVAYDYGALENQFAKVTIPADAMFIEDGTEAKPEPCKYDWPTDFGSNGENANYDIKISVRVNGAYMQRSDPGDYSSTFKYSIVNHRVALEQSTPNQDFITSSNFMKNFIMAGKVYGFGKVEVTYTVGSTTPVVVPYYSYDSTGVPVTLPQEQFIALCNSGNTNDKGAIASSDTTLTVKANAINGLYPTNPQSVTMSFVQNSGKIPSIVFQNSFPSNTNILMLDLLAPITTKPANLFVQAIGYLKTIQYYPFGNDDKITIVGGNPTAVVNGELYGTTLPLIDKYAFYAAVEGYILNFDNVLIVPEFTVASSVSSKSDKLNALSTTLSAFVMMNPIADAMIKADKRSVIFTLTKSGTTYAIPYCPSAAMNLFDGTSSTSSYTFDKVYQVEPTGSFTLVPEPIVFSSEDLITLGFEEIDTSAASAATPTKTDLGKVAIVKRFTIE